MLSQTELIDYLACARRGEPLCERTLYEAYVPFVYNLVLKYIEDSDDAADVAQETMIHAFEKLSNYNPDKGAFKSWIAKIAIHRALKWTKRKRQFVTTDQFERLYEHMYQEEEVESYALKARLQLDESQRELFNLYFELGFSHKEIADAMGISISNSRVKIFRLVTYLKSLKL